MKKYVSLFLVAVAIATCSAQTVPCLDFSTNLSRGTESGTVLSLQTFLVAKGFLKAVPNGYFGSATLAAVKAYQKSKGLAQVGNTGPATRAALKRDSCTQVQTGTQPSSSAATTTIQATSTAAAPVPAQTLPRPAIDSFDVVTLFAGAKTDWGFSMYGSNFSTSSNVITMRNLETRKIYTIGGLVSATGTAITLPDNFTGTAFPCGSGCQEKLAAGKYEVTVTTSGGTSDVRTLTIAPFTMSAYTSAVSTIPESATNVRLGVFSYSTTQAVIVKSLSFDIATSTISSDGLANIVLIDQLTGEKVESDSTLSAFQSGFVAAYGDTNNTKAGQVYGTFTVTIRDHLGQKDSSFTSSPIMMTVAGVI